MLHCYLCPLPHHSVTRDMRHAGHASICGGEFGRRGSGDGGKKGHSGSTQQNRAAMDRRESPPESPRTPAPPLPRKGTGPWPCSGGTSGMNFSPQNPWYSLFLLYLHFILSQSALYMFDQMPLHVSILFQPQQLDE